MRSNQVYQPTTTSIPYDRNKSFIPKYFALSDQGIVWSKFLVVTFTLLFSMMGLIMIIVGTTSYKIMSENPGDAAGKTSAYVIILCIGIIFEIFAIAALITYYRFLGYYIPCCPGKIARIRKHLQESRIIGNSEFGHVEHPVSAQYCPPNPPCAESSPIHYTDVSEQQRLMEDKQEIGEDNDKILEGDPRLVLTPLKSHEHC